MAEIDDPGGMRLSICLTFLSFFFYLSPSSSVFAYLTVH